MPRAVWIRTVLSIVAATVGVASWVSGVDRLLPLIVLAGTGLSSAWSRVGWQGVEQRRRMGG
ncbi:hypothetical protein GCM10011594_18010 [Nakamurella endophytica]|uniref:Uncharacterized protein n=1 Tax=Nakamurella endophytica TaxID=1748367 RepID=A0A917SW59_9ACTN|nr:hypothetical protein GCM10011594_18010 [Nakamurella endophytica]